MSFRLTGRNLFTISLRCGIDAEIAQRYSEAQIPDLVANANPQVLEAAKGPMWALSRNGGVFVLTDANCAFRSLTASNRRGLVFASSSADEPGTEARDHRTCTDYSRLGGH